MSQQTCDQIKQPATCNFHTVNDNRTISRHTLNQLPCYHGNVTPCPCRAAVPSQTEPSRVRSAHLWKSTVSFTVLGVCVCECLFTFWWPLRGTGRWLQSCQAGSHKRAAVHFSSVLSDTHARDPTPPSQESHPGTAQECSWWVHVYS